MEYVLIYRLLINYKLRVFMNNTQKVNEMFEKKWREYYFVSNSHNTQIIFC